LKSLIAITPETNLETATGGTFEDTLVGGGGNDKLGDTLLLADVPRFSDGNIATDQTVDLTAGGFDLEFYFLNNQT
jgi:hypothetical protein